MKKLLLLLSLIPISSLGQPARGGGINNAGGTSGIVLTNNIAASNNYNGTFTGDASGATNIIFRRNARTRYATNFTDVTVRDFGANGDDSADDTAAIQAAVYFSQTNSGEVYFHPGTYIISNTITIPQAGGLGLTNRLTLKGDSWASTIITAPNLTNKNMFLVPGFWTNEAHVKFKGLWMKGPHNAVAGQRYETISQVPYTGACIAIGNTNTYTPGLLLGAFDTLIEECRLEYNRYGIAMTNCQNLRVVDTWIQLNLANVILAHVDTVHFLGGHYGTLLVTNHHERVYSFHVIGTPSSTWGGSEGADSGVHKIFEGLEHEGPFMYADQGHLQVIGGQFEIGQNTETPLTNGWCQFTNWGFYKFQSSAIHLPEFTNTFLFQLRNGANAGLRLEGCAIGSGMDPLYLNPHCTFFDIYREVSGTNFYLPYWDAAVHGTDADPSSSLGTIFTDLETSINTRLDRTNYLHIKQMGGDRVNVMMLRRNGKQIIPLDIVNGWDNTSRNRTTNNVSTEGPWLAPMTGIHANLVGNALAWEPGVFTGNRFWAVPPIWPKPNPDGHLPRNFRLNTVWQSTNNVSFFFTDYMSTILRGTGLGENKNGSGITSYVGTNRAYTLVHGIRQFSDEPAGGVNYLLGINNSGLALTNRLYLIQAWVECW